MAYTTRSRYLKLHDWKAAPIHMEWIAGRYGEPGTAGWRTPDGLVYLDLGCAEGNTIQILAPLYPQLKFIGVDINPEHIAAAQEAQRGFNLTNVEFLHADFGSIEALPAAAYINLHGVYSWLSDTIRQRLERRLESISRPGALLKLHYNVQPGAQLRENLGHMFQALGADATPARARELLDLIGREASGLKMLYAPTFLDSLLKRMAERSDEIWEHDYLSADFKAEYSDVVMGRLKAAGFEFIASSEIEQNIPSIIAKPGIGEFAAGLQSAARHSFMDHVTGRGYREDLFVKRATEARESGAHERIRLGSLWPREQMLAPFITSQGQLDFRNQASQQIVDALMGRPLTLDELRQRLPAVPVETLLFWTDLLMAASRVAPFLPEQHVAKIDRGQLRNLNRMRLAETMRTFSAQSSTSLLAAELGNCIDIGWFETLVSFHFEQRHEPQTQRRMLELMADAGIKLAEADGSLSRDQGAAMRTELARLEERYRARLDYWGVEL